MEQQLTTHLNPTTFKLLIEQQRPKESFVLQVIDIFEPSEDKKYTIAILSDGHLRQEFFVLPTHLQKFETEVKQGSVIKALMSFNAEKRVFLLIDFTMVYRDCAKIGHPEPLDFNTQNYNQQQSPSMIP
jgi:hypothetical protein